MTDWLSLERKQLALAESYLGGEGVQHQSEVSNVGGSIYVRTSDIDQHYVLPEVLVSVLLFLWYRLVSLDAPPPPDSRNRPQTCHNLERGRHYSSLGVRTISMIFSC